MQATNREQNLIAGCEAEQLSRSGAIQPHGAMLHLDAERIVTHASANIGAFLPLVPGELLGRPLPPELVEVLEGPLNELKPIAGSRAEAFSIGDSSRMHHDYVLTRSDEGIVIELSERDHRRLPITAHRVPMKTPANAQAAQDLHNYIARILHELTGFNRVMIYVFRDDGDGEVIAEARHEDIYGSYVGLRFPGSDIPQIARNLYKKNPWRLIPDSQAPAVPLLSRSGSPPDLTWSDLRSVSPVHQVYLANMGVRASLSLPIMVGSELWGLIACHHAEARTLPLATMRAASTVARHYSLVISTWIAETRMRFVDRQAGVLDPLRDALQRFGGLVSAMPEITPTLFALFAATGLAIRIGSVWAHTGDSPNLAALEKLSAWLESRGGDTIRVLDSVTKTLPEIGNLPIAGALAIHLATRERETLQVWLFRRELVEEVHWGGKPNKPVEFNDGQLGIAPRRSFDKWVEKRRGYCKTWLEENRLAAMRLRQILVELYA